MSGVAGQRGERGPKGDHGQDGARGPAGHVGLDSPYLGKAKTLVLFTFVVLAFVLLAYRSEMVSSNLERINNTQQHQFDTFQKAYLTECQQRIAYDKASVEFRRAAVIAFRDAAQQEKTNKFIDDILRKQRADNYTLLADKAQASVDAPFGQSCEAFK